MRRELSFSSLSVSASFIYSFRLPPQGAFHPLHTVLWTQRGYRQDIDSVFPPMGDARLANHFGPSMQTAPKLIAFQASAERISFYHDLASFPPQARGMKGHSSSSLRPINQPVAEVFRHILRQTPDNHVHAVIVA